MKLELSVLAGSESKKFLVDFAKQLDRLEKLTGRLGGDAGSTDVKQDEESDDAEKDEDEELAPAPKKKTKAAAFEDSEEDGESDEESDDEADEELVTSPKKKAKAASFGDVEDEEEVEEAPKKTKTKKITLDDVNDACKNAVAYLIENKNLRGKDARDKVLALLTKKFKVNSVGKLKPEQYADAIKALAV